MPTTTTITATLPSPNPSSSFWHTEPSSLLLGHRSTRALPSEVDVAVVGSGISGASVVHHLFEHGVEGGKMNVLMLEAREVCWGATGRNGGHCQPIFYEHPHDPSIGRFEFSNFHTLESLINARKIDCEWNSQSGVRALYSSSDLQGAKASVSLLQQNDPELAAHVRVVTDEDELKKLRLNVPLCKGAVVTDVAARLWPYKLVARILEDLLTEPSAAVKLNLQTHTPVTSLQSQEDGKWCVQTSRGKVLARKVVLATNAYTSHLLSSFADLIVPCRGQMSALVPSTSFAKDHRTTASFGFLGPKQDDYLIQRPKGKGEHLMFGGGRSEGPSLGLSDDSEVDGNVAKYLRQAIPRLLVSGDGESESTELKATHQWTGIMGFSRDNLPWVGPVPEHEGVFFVGGYTGHGMPNAWLCGRALATMVRESMGGMEGKKVVETAVQQGLPRAYVLDEQRLDKARAMETVEKQDEEHMFKAEQVA